MIEKNSPIPFYHQIYSVLKQRIDRGFYPEGELLPSEKMLAEEFGVTRLTLRNAVRKLQEEGRIHTHKGKGSIVNSVKVEQSLFRFYSFGRNFSEDSYNPSTRVISASTDLPTEDQILALGLPQDSTVTKVVRVRLLSNSPVIAEVSVIPHTLAPDLLDKPLEKASIYDLLEHDFGHPIVKTREYLNTVNCDPFFANLLGIEAGGAVFVAERITHTTGGIPMEYRISYIRGDKFRFFVEF